MRLFSYTLLTVSLIAGTSAQTEKVEWGIQAPFLTLPGVFNVSVGDELNNSGFQLSQAFMCAVNQVSEKNLFPGLKIVPRIDNTGGQDSQATKFGQSYVKDENLLPFVFAGGDKNNIQALSIVVKDQGVSMITYYEPGTRLDAEPS